MLGLPNVETGNVLDKRSEAVHIVQFINFFNEITDSWLARAREIPWLLYKLSIPSFLLYILSIPTRF